MADTSIEKTVIELIKMKETQFAKKSSYINLKKFQERMTREGKISKPSYTLPLIDTMGRNWYMLSINR